MMEKINGLNVTVEGHWAEISDGNHTLLNCTVTEGTTPRSFYQAWAKALEPLWAGNAAKDGYYRWFSGHLKVDYIGAMVDGVPKWCSVTTAEGETLSPVLLDMERPETYRALYFDAVYASCPHAVFSQLNGGYGCSHPKQQEVEENDDGVEEGLCHCWSCPLGVCFVPDEDNSIDGYNNVYWADGFAANEVCPITDIDISDIGCLLVPDGHCATEESRETIRRHNRYLNRYNPDITDFD